MTLDQLRYFVAAAKYQHVNRAAQSIPISASVISHSIKQLEDELGCQLFVREKRNIRITEKGVRLLELSGDLLARASGIRHELGQSALPISGHYRIGASHFLAAKVLTPIWSKMQSQFPGLTVDMHSQPTWVLVDQLLAGRLDFAVGFSPMPHPQLETEEVFRGHSEVVARKGHPIFKSGSKTPYKLLADYPATLHIMTEKIFSSRNYPAFKNLNLEKNVIFSFDSDFAAVENLKASDNWAFMIDLIVNEFRRDLRIIEIPSRTEAHYTIQIMRHKSRKVDPAMAEFFERIKLNFARALTKS